MTFVKVGTSESLTFLSYRKSVCACYFHIFFLNLGETGRKKSAHDVLENLLFS